MNRFWWMWTAAAVLAAMAITSPVRAQEADDSATERETEVVIEVDEEGRVVVDGERVTNENARVVVRIAPNTHVDVDGPGDRLRMRGEAPHVERFVRRVGPPDERSFRRFMADFDPPRIADFEPMLERFRFEFEENVEQRIEEHREVADLERRSRELADQVRRAEGAERDRIETELRTTLDEIFDKKLQIRRDRVERLEERLQEQRADLSRRSSERESIIERRMRQLLGESDALEW